MGLPAWLLGWAAAVLLVVALVAVGMRWTTPPLARGRTRSLRRLPLWLPRACALAGLIAFAIVLVLGFTSDLFAGRTALHAWAVIGLVSAIAGDVFKPVNPWRAAAHELARRRPSRPRHYPDAVGRWPAAVGIVAFGVTQVAIPDAWQSAATAALLVAYAVAQVAGARRYGAATWAERGDGIALTLSAFARLAPLTVSGGWLILRRPLSDFEPRTWPSGSATLLATTIAIAAYDTAGHEPGWQRFTGDAREAIAISPELSYLLFNACGLLLGITFTLAIYHLGISGMRRVTPSRVAPRLELVLGSALVPVALSYLVAHQIALPAIDSAGAWYAQLAILTLGHLAAVLIAYDRGMATMRTTSIALRTTYWSLGVIVASLSFDLWLTWQVRLA